MDVESSAHRRQVKLWDWMRQSRTEKEELAEETDKEQLEKGKENQYSVMEINNNKKMFYKGESKDFFGSPEVRGPGSIPGQGTSSHIPQRRLKILPAATKTWHSQINNFFFFNGESSHLC